MTEAEFQALRISVQVAVLATALAAVPGTALGWWLARTRSPARGAVEAVAMMPLVLPPVATGMLLLIASLELGVPEPFTWPAAAAACAVVSSPLLVQSVRAAVQGVDGDLEGIARTLGASEWRVFRTVTLPLAWRGVAAGLLLAACRALGEFGATLVIAGSIPGRTRTLALLVHSAWDAGRETEALRAVGIAAALAFLLVLASLRVRGRA